MLGKAVVRFFIAARIAADESEQLAKFSGGTVTNLNARSCSSAAKIARKA